MFTLCKIKILQMLQEHKSKTRGYCNSSFQGPSCLYIALTSIPPTSDYHASHYFSTPIPSQLVNFLIKKISAPIEITSIAYSLYVLSSDTLTYILRSLFLEHFSTYANCTPVFTDGSKSHHDWFCHSLTNPHPVVGAINQKINFVNH